MFLPVSCYSLLAYSYHTFQIDQECSLHLSDDIKEDVIGVVGNRDRSLIALITLSSVHIYNAQVCSIRLLFPYLTLFLYLIDLSA